MMPKLKIEYRKPTSLIPYVGNARRHSPAQVAEICRSIQEFGFVNPVLIDKHNVIIAGHGRTLAAIDLKLETIPTVVVDGLSERQIKALIIADNQIAANATWDMDKLAEELSALAELEFDLSITGFDEQEIQALLQEDVDLLPDAFKPSHGGEFPSPAPAPAPVIPPPSPQLPEVQPGELSQVPAAPQPPTEFRQFDENIPTTHQCPSCGFEWTGPAK